jgi:hypothetical protein
MLSDDETYVPVRTGRIAVRERSPDDSAEFHYSAEGRLIGILLLTPQGRALLAAPPSPQIKLAKNT